MKFLMDSSCIPKPQQIPKKLVPMNEQDKKTFKYLNNIKNNIQEFVDQGKNLYICSNSAGSAKTSWAFKLILKYFDKIWAGNGLKVRGLFIHVPTFLQRLKDFNNPIPEEYKLNIMTCDIVIWDDIATTKLSDYEYNQLLLYIDSRILHNKSNIYTSNVVSKEKLDEILGARLSSRVFGLAEIATITADDLREGVK